MRLSNSSKPVSNNHNNLKATLNTTEKCIFKVNDKKRRIQNPVNYLR